MQNFLRTEKWQEDHTSIFDFSCFFVIRHFLRDSFVAPVAYHAVWFQQTPVIGTNELIDDILYGEKYVQHIILR